MATGKRSKYAISPDVAAQRTELTSALRTLDADRAAIAARALVEAKKAERIREARDVLTAAGYKVDES